MTTAEEVRDEMNDKIHSVDNRVSRLEGGYEHLATKADMKETKGELKADMQETKGELKADMKDLENRLFVRLGLLIVAVGAAVAVIQRL